ncbi:MAG: N-6 DNA methylase [Paludibacteraceae bacterium]|nr:N-6 DNA methylase [Paludibacteraceae bacterium]
MKSTYSSEQLRSIFQSSFNLDIWREFLYKFFEATELKVRAELIRSDSIDDDGYYLGKIDRGDFCIGLFYYEIKRGSVLNRRVGLRNLVRAFINPLWGEFDAALVVFDSGDHWRFSFICDIKGEATAPKRYTYVFGSSELLYRTPIDRFLFLQSKGISFENLKKAFSVEALSDEFFDKYREQYADFVQYITGKRVVKNGGKWEERVMGEPNTALMRAFDYDEKKIRDYIKKMMGRITFLHFLQRKGWLCGDLNYMQNMFERSKYKDNYLDAVLEPLFFGILNTKPAERESLFKSSAWDLALLSEWKDIPYLNGGLFERDEEDEPDSVFPADYFERLFNFFSEYNFTIDENDPNDAEVGVDPEMLGKIFENLLEDNKDKGAFYTPKEIVLYMCQESLIAYLETSTSIASDKLRKFVLSPEESVNDIPSQKLPKLVEALQNVKICDPAIGSGAFPMGLLNQLLRCREALSCGDYNRAELKKEIIQNNIYGVDIEKGAVDIARLRFWLSIVVDEDTPSPLPNLDYKIMQGNSLIESFEGVDLSNLVKKQLPTKNVDAIQTSILDEEIDIHQNRLSLLLSEYFTCCDHDRKVQLQAQISKSINAQLDANKINGDVLAKLKTINIAGNNQFFLWHTWFADVFAKGGFDIVIGNPPYITYRGKEKNSISNRELKVLISTYIHSAEYKVNSYALFIEAGINICNNQATLSYIIPGTILQNDYLKKIREFLICKNQIKEIVSFSNKVFDAVIDSIILRCTKGFIANNTMLFKRVSDLSLVPIEEKEFITEEWNNSDKLHIIDLRSTATDSAIFFKMEASGLKVEDYYNIYVGIVAKGIKQFLSNAKDTIYHKKYLQGKHIAPYQINYKSVYINFIPELLHSNTDQFVYEQKEKILVRKTGSILMASLDTEQYYTDQSLYNLYLKPSKRYSNRVLLAILNSKLLNYYYNKKLITNADVFPYIKGVHLKMFPLPHLSDSIETELSDLVDTIIGYKKQNIDTSEICSKINTIVYQLYGLTDSEIKIIEQSN